MRLTNIVVIKKVLFFVLMACIISCQTKYETNARFVCVIDSKPCTDSLYEIEGRYYNGRTIKFRYLIINDTPESVYLPIKTRSNDIVSSHINVFFANGHDTIVPKYDITKVPFNSDIIEADDSMWVDVEIFRFPDWQNANITVNTDVHDIANMLRVEYCKDVKDRNPQFNQYDLDFEQNHPNVNYFEIPRGSNIYPM
jgi:hypothetical protein